VLADRTAHNAYGHLVEVLRGRRLVALTGAGISTESGIPDYRGGGTARRARNPIQHSQFVSDAATRRHYWARSVVGWPRMRGAKPNDGHAALAELERAGVVSGVITQNVDRLHSRAGSVGVVELHGALQEVRCLDCAAIEDRDELQARLAALNPGWHHRDAEVAPDGDAELADTASFEVAACVHCGGTLMPNVVFFGGSVPRPVVDSAWSLLDRADALLVTGTSLAVFSGYRFVRKAAQRQLPIAIVNLGPTRGDDLANVRIEKPCGKCLADLARDLLE